MTQNPYFQPAPWELGTPVSWTIEGQHARSLGGTGYLRYPGLLHQSGDVVTFYAEVENPDGSEIAVGLGSNVLYSGSPATGVLAVTTTLTSAGTALGIRDISGDGTIRLTNVRLLS